MIETVVQDLKQGFRLLRRSPSLATTGIASLAVGIGACISMFILVNAVLFRPLPLPSPEAPGRGSFRRSSSEMRSSSSASGFSSARLRQSPRPGFWRAFSTE
jgi:hypothetical protein